MKTINNPQLHEGDYVLVQKQEGRDLYSYLALVKNKKTGKAIIITNGAQINSYDDVSNAFIYNFKYQKIIFLYDKKENWLQNGIHIIEKETIKTIVENQKNKVIQDYENTKKQLKKLKNILKQIK